MGTAQDLATGKRNPAVVAEGGEKMTGAQLDAIKGAEDAMAWEEQNKSDPQIETAITHLKLAVQAMEEAEKCLQRAAEAVESIPETDRIVSLHMGLEEFEIHVRIQIERMK